MKYKEKTHLTLPSSIFIWNWTTPFAGEQLVDEIPFLYYAIREIVVGVAEGKLLERKTLTELIEPTSRRMSVVEKFLCDVAPCLKHSIVAITDVAGPAGVRRDLDCLVLSRETLPGGVVVNLQRQKKVHCFLVSFCWEIFLVCHY